MRTVRSLLEELTVVDQFQRRIADLLHTGEVSPAQDLAQWMADNLTFRSANTPRGARETKQELQRLYDILKDAAGMAPEDIQRMVQTIMRRIPMAQIALFVVKVDATGQATTVIKLQHATYVNRSGMSEKNFRAYAKSVDTLLGSLRGWRRKAIQGNLKVAFVGKGELRAQGQYKEQTDELLVRATPQVLQRSAGYASVHYILIHELGHRYDDQHNLPQRIEGNAWYTTRYSHTEGFAGNEQFAELFALGHFGIRGTWGEVIDRFEKIMS